MFMEYNALLRKLPIGIQAFETVSYTHLTLPTT